MAKEKRNTPCEEILKMYEYYLKGKKLKSASFYRGRVTKSFLKIGFDETERNFFYLLPKLLWHKKYRRNSTEEIIQGLIKQLEQRNGDNKNDASYARKFLTFVKEELVGKPEFLKEFRKRKTNEDLKFTGADNATLANKTGEIYYPEDLKDIFSSRLKSQDRTSGDKVWLPLDFISSICTIGNKGNKNPSIFKKWIEGLVRSVIVHYECENIICHKQFGEDNYTLKFKENNNGEFDVYIYFLSSGKEEKHRVYTPTGNGNEKVPMTVKSIRDITIDHVIPIDQTLKNHEKAFKTLAKITELYKSLTRKLDEIDKELYSDDEKKKNRKIAKEEKVKEYLELQKYPSYLESDLELIADDSPLRLMDARYNSGKNNGQTFRKIVKANNGNDYYGIIRGREDGIKDENDKVVTFYQELTNEVVEQRQNGQLRVTTKTIDDKEKVDEIKGKRNLEEIIDRI